MTLEKDFVSHIPGVQGVEPPAGGRGGCPPSLFLSQMPPCTATMYVLSVISGRREESQNTAKSNTDYCSLDHGPQ